ncbi:family B DNA polymerase, partial [Klebsiella pneumoniae]
MRRPSTHEVPNLDRLLIVAFFLTKCVPSSIHAFPTVYRRAAVISDTDSTMFTLQWWVEEFFGKVTFSNEAKRLVFALVFLVSEVVMHILAIQSANMGVSKDKLRLFAMKNEFYFAVLALTTRSKHYFASQDAQEGVMFNESRMEIKGVGLR